MSQAVHTARVSFRGQATACSSRVSAVRIHVGSPAASRALPRVRVHALPPSAASSSPDGPVTGVIIVDHGSRRKESNQLVIDLAAMFKERTGYKIVEGAHMELADPSISDAYDACVRQGAKRVVVTPYFLGPGRHWQEDIPSLTAAAAARHSGTEFVVAAPLGLHPLVVEALHSRMEHCVAQAAAAAASEEQQACDVCGAVAGKGPCTLTQSAGAPQ